MKRRIVYGLCGFFLAILSLPGSVIHGTSSYGSPGTPSACGALCSLPAGVSVLENNYIYSDGSGSEEVFAFEITSPTAGDFTFTLNGTVPFIPYDSVNFPLDYPFGYFTDGDGGFSGEVDPSSYTTATADPTTASDLSSVTFTVDGAGDGVAFYAIDGDGGTVSAAFDYAGTVPEPRLLPIVVLLLAGGILLRRRFLNAA